MTEAPTARGNAPSIDHLVVVTIDGVRWQEIWNGPDQALLPPKLKVADNASRATPWLPNLHRLLAERGFLIGGNLSPMTISSPSTVSLPSYSELFSGQTPDCSNNDCPQTAQPTFLDRWIRSFPHSRLALVSSWAAIARVAAKDTSPLWVSAGRSSNGRFREALCTVTLRQTYETGTLASPLPGTSDYRPDHHTAPLALQILEEHAPEFLFLGLGDTDEYAHLNQYPSYLEALTYADSVIGEIDRWMAKREQQGSRTLLVVTTDHGRAHSFVNHGRSPEAARIWALFAGSRVTQRGRPPFGPTILSDLAPNFEVNLGLLPHSKGYHALEFVAPASKLALHAIPTPSEVGHGLVRFP